MQQGILTLLQRLVHTLLPKQHAVPYTERDDAAARMELRRAVARAYVVLLDQGEVSALWRGPGGAGDGWWAM